MTRSTAVPVDFTIAETISRSFPLPGPLHRLAGGEGRTYRAGDIVYRCESRIAEAAYIADVYDMLPASGFRLSRPIRSLQGAWVSPEGWSAWSYVPGRAATPTDVPGVIPAIHAFHRALAELPYPAFLATKDTPYTRADAAAWGTVPDNLDALLIPFVTQLVALRQPIPNRPAQLIHGDLNHENILIAEGVPPAIIDFTPGWRPVEYALAVFAYWIVPYHGEHAVLDLFADLPAFDQLLLRVALSKLLVKHELSKGDRTLTNIADEFGTPVRIIVDWILQRRR